MFVSIGNRKATTVQTHTSVSIPTVSSADGATWIDCDGYYEIAVTLLNDAATTTALSIKWSNDGITQHGYDLNLLPNATQQQRAASTSIKARYAKIQIYNGDTVSHVINAWTYLKA